MKLICWISAALLLAGCASGGRTGDSSGDDPSKRSMQAPLFQEESSHDEAKCLREGVKVGTIAPVHGRLHVMVAEGFPTPDAVQVLFNALLIPLAVFLQHVEPFRQPVCGNKTYPVEATVRPLDTFSADERKALDERRARDGLHGQPPEGLLGERPTS